MAYQFRVIAINAKGTSNVSNVATATPFTGTAVSAGALSTRTWTLAGSPYVINGNVSIASDAVLTIEAGVQVKFNGNYTFTIDGVLNSLGTESQRIVFTSAKPVPSKGDWRALQVNNPANKLQFLTVEYSDLGIFVITRHPVVNNPVIRNNIVRFNNNGIFFQPSTAPIIVNNTVTDNTYGINAFCNIFTGCAPTIVQNSILGNTTYNMFVQGGNAGLVIKAENNWWGSTDQNTIAASIFDHVDQASQATVDFIPYLTSLPQEQGVALTNLSVSNTFVNLRTTVSTDINYVLNRNANVTIKIFNATGTMVVRTLLNNQLRLAGSHAEPWDLRNDSLQLLPPGAYLYRIEARGLDGSFDFYGPQGLLSGSNPNLTNTVITPSSAFSPAKGERVKIEFNLDKPGLVSVGFEGSTFITDQLANAGANVLYWDGYNNAGLMNFYQNTVSIDALTKPLVETGIVLDSGRTLDIATGQADPYIIRPLYNEISTINYSINEAANVTIRVFAANGTTLLNTLENNVPRTAGSYQIIFDCRDANGATIAEEGDYRLRLEAVDSYGAKATRDVSVRILL